MSGYHTGTQGVLLQFGHSKDDPTLRQLKAMAGTLDPLGLPLVTHVVSGEQADDPLYRPAISLIVGLLGVAGLLFVGDAKMSVLHTWAYF